MKLRSHVKRHRLQILVCLFAAPTLLCCLPIALAAQTPAGQDAAQRTGEKAADPFAGFYWLSTATETRGLKFEARKLANLKVDSPVLPETEMESEVSRPNADTMRITRRVYESGANRERRVVEMVVEELRASPGGALSATRTISRLDSNGRLRPVRKDSQQTVPAAGAAEYRTEATTETWTVNNAPATTAKLVQVEHKKADGVIEIERTQMLPDAGGRLAAAEKRLSSTTADSSSVRTAEDVYRADPNGGLSLSQKITSREWRDSQGRELQESDSYRTDLQGTPQLDLKSSIVQDTFADGGRRTVQTLQQKNPASPSEGLRLIQRITETVTPVGEGKTQVDTEVAAPDGNKAMVTVSFRRAVEKR
jgi:hypothetical protein